MKNLFNNPWFIVGLGAFAMIYLGSALIEPMFGGPDIAFDGGDEFELFSDFSNADEGVDTTVQSDRRKDIGWLHDIDRDPFAGTLISKQHTQALPTVAALFTGAGVQAAVVNNRLVYIGDMIDHYRITDIAAQHVQVSRAGRSYRLEPDV